VLLSILTNDVDDSEPLSEKEFRECFDLYFNSVRNFIYYRYRDKELAEDMAQDAFVKLWENRHKIRRQTLRNYLYAVAANSAATLFQRKLVHLTFESSFKGKSDRPETPEEAMMYDEFARKLERALSKLPDGAREVFLMSRVDDVKIKDIADSLGLTIKAIEKRITKARLILKQELGLDL
jgi:RNA polymerase sigma-70 factor (family 1)